MKKLKTALSLFAVCLLFLASISTAHAEGDVAIDESNFPDVHFRSYVANKCDTDMNGFLSTAEVADVTKMDISRCGIGNLKGIEYFTALTELDCGYNLLESINLSANTALTKLYCGNNRLTSLDVSSNTALTSLSCSDNKLTSLDVHTNTALQSLYCDRNRLTALDVSANTALTDLYCDSNYLSELDVSANNELNTLWCHNNQLTSLNVSANTALAELECGRNQLTSLDLSANAALWNINCEKNRLATLDLSANPEVYLNNYGSQMLEARLMETGDSFQLDLTQLVGAANAGRVTVTAVNPSVEYSMTNGVVTANESIKELTYQYDCGNNQMLDVSVAVIRISDTTDIPIDVAHFPDAGFRDYIYKEFDKDQSRSLSTEEIANATRISLYQGHDSSTSIYSISGIEYFKALTSLSLSGFVQNRFDLSSNTALTELSFSSMAFPILVLNDDAALKDLSLSYMEDSSLDLSTYTGLTRLTCTDGNITSLDVSANTALTSLDCQINKLTSLDLHTNTALQSLTCSSNNLSKLDVSANTALTRLDCSYNKLTSLDLHTNTALQSLTCSSNNLSKLDVSANTALATLYCYHNNLTELDVRANTALTYLDCASNNLSELDVRANTALTTLDCASNNLSALDVSSNTDIRRLNCENNHLTSLDLSANSRAYSYKTYDQTAVAELTESNGRCSFDFADVVGAENVNRVSVTAVEPETAEYSYTDGILSTDRKLLNLTYQYVVPGPNEVYLNVTLELSEGEPPVDDPVINIDSEYFPDAAFRSFVEQYDTNRDGKLNEQERQAVTEINVLGLGITDLTGISAFPALQSLNCSYNGLNSLDLSKNGKLTNLNCSFNQLSKLIINTKCTIDCEHNHLAALHSVPSSSCFIGFQSVDSQMTAVDGTYRLNFADLVGADNIGRVRVTGVLPNVNYTLTNGVLETSTSLQALKYEYMYDYMYSSPVWMEVFVGLTSETVSIDQSHFPDTNFRRYIAQECDKDRSGALSADEIVGTPKMDVSGLEISDLTGIELFQALEELNCSNNQLTDLDMSANTALQTLYCYNNELKTLKVIDNTALKTLNCDENHLTSLDVCENTYVQIGPFSKGQEASAEITKVGNSFLLDFANLVGAENIDKVYLGFISPADATYNLTNGILISDTEITNIFYSYNRQLMVNLDTSLGSVTADFVLPDGLREIGEEAFTGAVFSYVHVPEQVTTIGARAFAACPNLRFIDIPAATTEIDASAFAGDTRLTIVGKTGSYAQSFALQNGYCFAAG